MKRFCLMAVMFCMGLFAGGVYAQSAPPQAQQQQIKDILANMGRAAEAHDTKRFMAGFRHVPELVFVFNGSVIHGWDALYA